MAADFFERRDAPRIPLNGEKALRVRQEVDVRLLDISLGGVRFRSANPFQPGVRINIGNDLLNFGATVLECLDLNSQPGYDPKIDQWAAHPYSVRCEYTDDEDQEDIGILMSLVMEEEEEDGIVI